jgi:hypothetical protein
MPSNRWLKAVPPSDKAPAPKPEPPPNVSMRDLRRLQDEKRKKLEGQDNQIYNSEQTRQPTESSQLTASSQPREQPDGGPESNQLAASSQPRESSQPGKSNQLSPSLNILALIPDVKGDARLPHRFTDHLCRLLNPYEQAVYLQLYRLSWGWSKETCFISNPRLSERSNVPLSTMKRVVVSLINKGLIEKTGHTNGYGKDQGVEYRLLSLGWQPRESNQPAMSSQPALAPNKVNTQKENTQTQSGVGVGSKFSLEECRRYAEHLQKSGQGINNPGGYATIINRTGEADVLIESFLNPPVSISAIDISQCLECRGSGFYYPDGPNGGVAKCKHNKLIDKAQNDG